MLQTILVIRFKCLELRNEQIEIFKDREFEFSRKSNYVILWLRNMIFQKLSSDYDNLHFKLVGDNVAKVSKYLLTLLYVFT